MTDCVIREGREDDVPGMLRLVKELAEYEKAAGEVEVDLDQMKNSGFGEEAVFKSFVAESNAQLVGMALYYYKYSTWKGKCIFLEDIIVTSSYRGNSIGTKLFERVIDRAKAEAVKRLEWQVLDWNTPAIKFYKKFKTHFDDSWVNCKLTDKELQSL